MAEVTIVPRPRVKRFHFEWVLPVLFRPRSAFAEIAAQNRPVWFTPLLVITLAGLAQVAASGWLRRAAALTGQVQLPPEFQYYPPEMQAQVMQAIQATSSGTFVYVIPALWMLVQVWLGWLIVSGLVHFMLTALGGRSETGSTMNLVAWAALPFAIRDLVRAGSMWMTRTMIQTQGLSGFTPVGEGDLPLFLNALFSLIDIFLIWHIVLLSIGAQPASGLPARKAVIGVTFVLVTVVLLQALVSFGVAKLDGLTFARPFFY